MKLAEVSAKGQVTIPVEILGRLRLKEGDKLLFIERYREVVIDNASSFQAQDALAGASRDLPDIFSDKKVRDLFDNLYSLSDAEMQNLFDKINSLSDEKVEDLRRKVFDLHDKLLSRWMENFKKMTRNLLSDLRKEDF